jgi:hypothetical protein
MFKITDKGKQKICTREFIDELANYLRESSGKSIPETIQKRELFARIAYALSGMDGEPPAQFIHELDLFVEQNPDETGEAVLQALADMMHLNGQNDGGENWSN